MIAAPTIRRAGKENVEMTSFTEKFNQKAQLLWENLSARGECYKELSQKLRRIAAFISVSDIHERAYVFRAADESAEKAWEKAKKNALEFISAENLDPAWVKADVTSSAEKRSLAELLSELPKGQRNFFREGISFDDTLDRALIEAELNTCMILDYKSGSIDIKLLNRYLSENDMPTLSKLPEQVFVFSCESAFCDEKSAVYSLYSDSRRCGRRVLERFERENAYRVVASAADYLAMQIGLDGKFDYGFFPALSKEIEGYNILRHTASIWSLLCAYRLTHDRFLKEQIDGAVGYMIRNMMYKYPDREGKENVLYLADKTKNEVKLGGNAAAIIVLTEYMDIFATDKYTKLAKELGNGILELFDERDGSFFHVLKYPSLAPRDKFRTVYYDGEAVFGLSRLFGLTKDKRYIDAARQAVDRFIEKNYEQYADHWVAYSVNELTKYYPLAKYLNFGIKNVEVNLDKIRDQPTTYHTYLELLCASFELADRIRGEGLKCPAMESFDMEKLVNTIFYRADHMLNGYGYPEYVMYFEQPSSALGAFFIRQDDFRIRIDDIQHFTGAYYSVYKNYEKLNEIREHAV